MPLSADARRSQLEDYAKKQLGDANTTKAQAFVNILDRGTDLVKDLEHPAKTLIDDLKAVLVGDDQQPYYLVVDEYTTNRGRGQYYAGDFAGKAGSTGFKPEFQDESYQVQHAMAGIAISYEYGGLLGLTYEAFLIFMENVGLFNGSAEDARLYKATFEIGNRLSQALDTYDDLPKKVTDAIGDGTVYVNLLQNGSFEAGTDPGTYLSLAPGSKDIHAWEVTRGSIDYTGTYWVASDGDRSLDLNGTPGVGGVAQTFTTTPGQSYQVSFDLAGHFSGLLQQIRVSAAGQSTEFSFQSGTDQNNLGWQRQAWDFTATAAQTTLEFYSLQTGYAYGGPTLDNVRVEISHAPTAIRANPTTIAQNPTTTLPATTTDPTFVTLGGVQNQANPGSDFMSASQQVDQLWA